MPPCFFCVSNFDLSSTMFALAKAIKKFCPAFSKAGARRAGETAFSFCKAFSFGPFSSKEKASNKS